MASGSVKDPWEDWYLQFPDSIKDLLPTLSHRERSRFKASIKKLESYPPKQVPNQDELLAQRLYKFSQQVCDQDPITPDAHFRFRLLSKAIFGTEHDYMLMRTCLAAQISRFRSRYLTHLFENDSLLREFYEGVRGDDSSNDDCFYIACDLFKIVIRVVSDDCPIAVKEYSPNYPNLPLQDDVRHFFARKTVWLSDSLHSGMQSLIPLGSVPYAADLDPLLEVMDDYVTLVNRCQNFVELSYEQPVTTTDEEERLNWRIFANKYRRVKIIGDGNCLIRALSRWLLAEQKRHKLMRKLVLAQLRSDCERYLPLCTQLEREGPSYEFGSYYQLESWDEYILRMGDNYEWGDFGCLQAAVDLFHVKLVVLGHDESELMYEFFPDSEHYHFEMTCCINSCHMDIIVPEGQLDYVA